jgi:hypothetical protein
MLPLPEAPSVVSSSVLNDEPGTVTSIMAFSHGFIVNLLLKSSLFMSKLPYFICKALNTFRKF